MWEKRREKAMRKLGRLGGFLDEGSELEGKYTCGGTVVVEANFRGEITSKDTLIIGERGVVQGPVQAATLVVRGALIGDATASERVELRRSARVTGGIEAPVIVMDEGAVHDGHCRMAKARSEEAEPSVVIPIKRA
jgi:cytoskeletal protein CcmA (bactofilin family)